MRCDAPCISAPTSGRSPAPATTRVKRALSIPASTSIRGRSWSTTSTRSAPRPGSRTRCSRRSTASGRTCRDAQSTARRASSRRSQLGLQTTGSSPVARRSRPTPGDRGPALPRRRDQRAHGDARRLGAPVALPPLRLPIATRDRGEVVDWLRCKAPTVLARLLRPRALHRPQNARSEHQARYRGTIRWRHAHKLFEAWCEGRTGYPMVDAGMRQLGREGYMDNRARLVVGSFLTKDLGIDWRWGERWLMRLLLDGDEASNNGNWQWIASVGVDPQPVVTPDPQPGTTAGQARPGWELRRKVRPRAQPKPGRLPEADRRPPPGPARSARPLPRSAGALPRQKEHGAGGCCASGPEQHLPQL